MRSLSFADQVRSLGAEVARRAIEAEDQRRALDAVLAARRGRGNARRVFGYDHIVAAMKPNRAYRWTEIEAASGLPPLRFKSALTTALRNGCIHKFAEPDGSIRYSLPC